MRFSNVLAASVVAPLVAAHGGIEGAPKLFGMPKQLRSRNPFASHQAPRSLVARQDSGEVCGPTNGNKKCPAGECCSSAGWCGTTPEHCQAPDCQIDFSDSCDASYTPVGETTRNDPRPQLGNIPYGGEGIYVCDRPGTVALTYDDGPYIYTDAMLTLLKEYGAKATFFVTGNNIGKGAIDENWQPVIKRMIAEGHQVASHTWSHQDLSAITREEVYDQMIKNEMAIRNIIGKYPTYMRPPYSSCTAANCQPILKELGYVVSYFDLDTDDYNQQTKEKIETAKANFKNGIDTRNNDPYDGDRLVIAHDIHELTAVDLTKYMLEYIKTNNLKAVTMGECLNDPEANWYRSSTPGQPRPSSTRSATPSKTPSPPSGPTTDGQCGADKAGYTCAGFLDQDGKAANCCSASGWCGNTADHCGTGCQSLFGDCGSGAGSSSVKPTSSATQVSSTSASAHTPTPTYLSGETSRDGSCGGEKGYTCKGFSTLGGVLSECCSQYGYCGSSAEYCGTGCNSWYGKCDGDVSSSVPSSTKHDSTSSSAPSSSKHDSTSSAYDHSSTQSASYSASETSKHESSSVHPSATSSGYPQSSPSNTDAYPTSSKDAYPTGSKDSYPSNSKDSYPTGSQDSYPSNSKDSYPTSSKGNTYPTSSKDNTYPTSSKDNSYPTSSKDNSYPTATTSPCSTLKTVVKPSSSPCESSSVKPSPTPYLPVSSDGKCGKDNNGQTCAGYTDPFGNKLECCCAQSGKCSNDPWACSTKTGGCNAGYGKCKEQGY